MIGQEWLISWLVHVHKKQDEKWCCEGSGTDGKVYSYYNSLKAYSLHEDPTLSIHSLDRTGSAGVYFITLTTHQALAHLTQ